MKQKWKRYSASLLALLLCVTLLASTAFAAGGALGADRNGTQYTYVIGYMYSGSSQTVNTREIFTSPNNYDIWLCPVCGRDPVSYTHLQSRAKNSNRASPGGSVPFCGCEERNRRPGEPGRTVFSPSPGPPPRVYITGWKRE